MSEGEVPSCLYVLFSTNEWCNLARARAPVNSPEVSRFSVSTRRRRAGIFTFHLPSPIMFIFTLYGATEAKSRITDGKGGDVGGGGSAGGGPARDTRCTQVDE